MLTDIIKNRRTVRAFKDKKVERETLEKLLMYASMAPSNGNAHPVEFLVIDDKENTVIYPYGKKNLSKERLKEVEEETIKFLEENKEIHDDLMKKIEELFNM